ncbi:MAG TPA: DUF6036 family nucleotidyltransferase [Terracidiphilus sp.]|nr:DUF6036 family nucleotidyltransferase [Terracidiphilus sp.]
MYQDYKDLLSAFRSHGVKYLIVGGYAVILHAQPRFTRDIDFFVKADRANVRALYSALADFGAPPGGLRAEDFEEPGSFFRFGRDPFGFDILPEPEGVQFDAAWENRIESVIDPESGLTAYFISASDLIAAKLAAGRPQDIADAEAVRKAMEAKQRLSSSDTDGTQ